MVDRVSPQPACKARSNTGEAPKNFTEPATPKTRDTLFLLPRFLLYLSFPHFEGLISYHPAQKSPIQSHIQHCFFRLFVL